MDYFSIFQHELYDTNEKLMKIIALQAAELQALRETMCTACKQKCAALSPSTHRPPYDSTLAVHPLKQSDTEDDTPTLFRVPKMKGFWRTLASCSSYLSMNEAITSISNSLAEISTEQSTDDPTFYAQKDDLADTTVNVGFVQSLSHEERYISSASCDGGYLGSSSSSPPRNETTASNPMVEISLELRTENNDPTFYARKDDLADATLDVGFVYSFCHEKKSVFSLCFSCDGSYLAVATREDEQGSIVVYEMESRSKYCELKEYASQYGSYKRPTIASLCFSANGKYLAAGDYDRRFIIWDLPNKRIRSIFQGPDKDYISRILFSPDGRLVAFCVYSELVVLNVRDNSRKMTSWWCSCYDFGPDGRHIATGNADGNLAILDVRTGKAVKIWNAHGPTPVSRVKFNSEGNRLLCSYGGVMEQWDVNEAEAILICKFNISGYLYAISPDNRLLACSRELCDVDSGKRQCIFEGHIGIVDSVDFSAAGTYLAIGDLDGVVSLWKYTRT